MIATLGYCLRDEEITLELAHWIKDLGGCPAHDLFLIHDRRCNKNLVQTILDAFIASFKAVYPGEAPAEIDGWPQGANYFMRLISGALQQKPYNDFLWLEPDAIPLVPGWMDAIEKEYRSCGKPFMGDRVDVDKVDLHMSGIGVYHNPLYAHAGEAYRASDEAWDMAARYQILPKAHFTKLIEHAWKHPPFTMMTELQTQIRKEAVLFHASKDGSLIRLLRQKLFPAVPVLAEPLTDEREGLPQPFMSVAKRSLPVCGEAKDYDHRVVTASPEREGTNHIRERSVMDSRRQQGNYHSLWPRKCDHCGADYLAQSNDVKLGRARFCSKKCHASVMRHEGVPDVPRDKKRKVYAVVETALSNGLLTKEPCEHCGDEKSEAHHKDYDQPLEVTWLCRSCHTKLHMPRGSRETSLSGGSNAGQPSNAERDVKKSEMGTDHSTNPLPAQTSMGGDKDVARQQLRDAVKAGTVLKPKTCATCNRATEPSKLHGHHTDYNHLGGGGERQTEVEVRANASSSRFPQRHDPPQPASATCDIFIRTYPCDYHWLKFCLQAINKFASGFRKIWIVSPQEMPMMVSMGYEWKMMNDETEDGYLAQQITKLYADVITDYQAAYILHIDSDVILTRPITPETFLSHNVAFLERNVIWPYTPYIAIETPWQPITEKFMGDEVKNEFMRRFPIMIPRWLYPRLREFCHQRHGMIISDYIRNQPHRAFSEFNALGAYAYAYHHDKFMWLDTLECALPAPCARQFHSYSGITPEVKTEIETILSGSIAEPARRMTESQAAPGEPESLSGQKPGSGSSTPPAQTPFDGTESKPVDESGSQVTASRTPSVPSPIKVLPNDLWILKGDQVSQWVEQEGRLDHDQNLLPKILEHIKPGDVVLDVGAFIGDHTLAYARAVGETGVVYAFEPNPAAFQCLEHNTQMHNVQSYNYGLGDKSGVVPLSGNNGNSGGVYVGEHMKIADAMIWPLDLLVGRETLAIPWQPDLIKIDVEGYELKVLRGAEKTITKYHPKLVIEINEEALRRQDTYVSGVFQWLENHGYTFSIMQENCDAFSPLYDILALPLEVANDKEVRAEVAGEEPGSPPEAPPKDGIHFLHADEPPTEVEQRLAMSLSLVDHVKELETYARQGTDQMKYVRKLLKKRGIMPMVRRKR